MPLLNEAMFAVMEGVATPEAVDEVFKLGMAHPMGPLTLADFIGLDMCLDIMRVLQDGLGDPKYRPCPLLIRMVDAGWLGRKSGRWVLSVQLSGKYLSFTLCVVAGIARLAYWKLRPELWRRKC